MKNFLLIVALSAFALKAQTQLPSYVFYADEYFCHVSGGTTKNYVLFLYPDSSVTFSLYTQETGNFLSGKGENEFKRKGAYSINGDTLTVLYEVATNILPTSRFADSCIQTIAIRNSKKHFLFDRKRNLLLSLDSSLPQMETVSLPELNQLLTKRTRFQLRPKPTLSIGQVTWNINHQQELSER